MGYNTITTELVKMCKGYAIYKRTHLRSNTTKIMFRFVDENCIPYGEFYNATIFKDILKKGSALNCVK